MDEKLKSLLVAATDESLMKWTDPKMVGRAYGYLNKVEGLSFIEGKGIVAKVHGSEDYYTHVFSDETGNLEAECSCPVAKRCKHSVAAILECARRIAAGEEIKSGGVADGLWIEAQAAFAASNERWDEIRQKAEERLLAKKAEERQKEERLDEIMRREEEWFSNFKAKVGVLQDELHQLCREDGREDSIIEKAEELLSWAGDDDLYRYPRDLDDVFKSIESTMADVVSALRRNGKSAADIIVWAVSLTYCYSGFYSPDAISGFLDLPESEYAKPEVWREVAERLQRQMDEFTQDEGGEGEHSRIAHQINYIEDAWCRAGCEANAAEYMVKYVSRVGNWKETAEFLNRHSMYDEAIKIARAGIKASRYSSEYGNDYMELMQEPLADAFAGKGDHAKAAAILAEEFLEWMGCYEHHRTVKSFYKILDEAEKAGVRNEVEQALLQALKTGVNPGPLQEWKAEAEPEEEDFPWRRRPKRVSYRAYDALPVDPPWPLARANEGIQLCELRWDISWDWCQFDQEFLLMLAVDRGDREEVAQRFCDLPMYPKTSEYYCRYLDQMMDAIMEMMNGFRPDIVDVILDPHKHWSSPRKNPFRAAQGRIG